MPSARKVAAKSRIFDYNEEKWIAIPVEIYRKVLDDILIGWFEGNELVGPGHAAHPFSAEVISGPLQRHKLDIGEAMKVIESGRSVALVPLVDRPNEPTEP
jgi:hypothetical protein